MSTEHPRRKLLFHIGHHKTGSTSIQDAFATGRVKLEGQRILYPGRMAHNYLARHFDVYANAGKVLPDRPGFPGLEEISRQLRLGDFDVAVISAEEFESADPVAVQKVLQDFMLPHVTDHSVICYVRPHAARILSSFAEQMKLGLFAATPEAFFEKAVRTGRFFYSRRLPQWAKVFQDHFKLRPMIRAQLAGGSVLEDFVQTGFDPGAPVRIDQAPAANESLCLEDLILVKLVQDCLASRDQKLRHAMGWEIAPAFATAARPQGPGTKLALHKALAERIRTTYRADAREIDTLFFNGKPLLSDELDRAVDEALPTAQSFEPSDHFSADALRSIVTLGQQIDRMLDHRGEPWQSFLVERRIRRLHKNDISDASPTDSQRKLQQSFERAPLIPRASLEVAQSTPLFDFVSSAMQDSKECQKKIPKIIWIFWNSGFNAAPEVVRRSLQTWRYFNPDHEVRALNLEAANDLLGLNLEKVFSEMSVDMGWTGKSDLIRLLLLAKYGGIWVDATTFCLKPLSEWLYDEMAESGFFSFREVQEKRDHELVSWFMAARPGHPVICQTLVDAIGLLFKKRAKTLKVTEYKGYRERYGIDKGELPGREFLLECEQKHGDFPYFWMFYIFRDVIRDVPGARDLWMKQSNRFSQGKHDMKRFARSFVSKQSYKGSYQASQFYLNRVAAVFDGDSVRADYRASD